MKHERQISECAGKQALPSRAKAREVAKRMRRKKGAKVAEYQCPQCGKWHVGHKTEVIAESKWEPRKEQDRPTPQRRQKGEWVFVSTDAAGQSVAKDMASTPIDRLEHSGVISNEQASAARDFESLYIAAQETPSTRDSTTIWEPRGHDETDGPVSECRDRREIYLMLGMVRDRLLRRVCVQHQKPRRDEIGPLREALNECCRFFK